MNITQSQYETTVGTGVLVAGMGVAVAGTGVDVGAIGVTAPMVWVTTACMVAAASLEFGWPGPSSGIAIKVTGKQAMMAKAKTPNKIRIELVVSFISHLHIVLLMDGVLNMNVPHFAPCYRTVTATL